MKNIKSNSKKENTFFDIFGDKIILFSSLTFFIINLSSMIFMFVFPQDFFFTDSYAAIFFLSQIIMIFTCFAYMKNGSRDLIGNSIS